MNAFTYKELRIGMAAQFPVAVTEKMMADFQENTGDINPLHTNADFARRKGYGDRVCYGMMTASFLSTLAGVYIPGEKALIHEVNVKFTAPVFVGDILTVAGEVTELNDSVRQVVLKVTVVNQKNEKVLRGTMKVGVMEDEG